MESTTRATGSPVGSSPVDDARAKDVLIDLLDLDGGLIARLGVGDDDDVATADRARELVERAQAAGLGATAGRHPEGLAAACLVIAYDLTDRERPFMLIDRVEASELSVATLRERRKDVRELIGQ